MGRYKCKLIELDHRSNDRSVELLRVLATANPKNTNEYFQSSDVCHLIEKSYPEYYNDYNKALQMIQLQHANYKQLKLVLKLYQ